MIKKIYYERDLFLRALWDFKGQWILYTQFKIHFFSTANSRNYLWLNEIWKNLNFYINTCCFKKTTFIIFPLSDNSAEIQVNLSYLSNVLHLSDSQSTLHWIPPIYQKFWLYHERKKILFFLSKKISFISNVVTFFKDVKYYSKNISVGTYHVALALILK